MLFNSFTVYNQPDTTRGAVQRTGCVGTASTQFISYWYFIEKPHMDTSDLSNIRN